HIQPVEMPGFIDRKKIFELAGLVPVVLRSPEQRRLAGPIDELRAIAIDIVDDGIDDELAGLDRADANIGMPVKDRLVEGYAAPGVNALKRQFLIGIKLPPHRGIDAVAGKHDARTHRRHIRPRRGFLKKQRYAVVILFNPYAAAICDDAV